MAETKLKGVFIMRLFSKNEIGVFDDLNTTAFLTLPYTSVNLQLSIMQSVLDGSHDDEETSENSNVPITNTFERTFSNRISNGVSIRGGRCNAFEVKSDCTVMLFSPTFEMVIRFHVNPQKRGIKALHFMMDSSLLV